MTTIIVTHEDSEVSELVFDAGQDTISIGRRSSNDVCIPDLSVSGNHACITFEADDYWLEDLNSTNGTYVNGQPVTRQIILDNDEIVIGKIRMAFLTGKADLSDVIADVSTLSGEKLPVTSDFGDGHVESIGEIDPLSMNEAHQGIDQGIVVPEQPELPLAGSDVAGAKTSVHPLDGLGSQAAAGSGTTVSRPAVKSPVLELDSTPATSKGAVIEIKNGAKSGQILPIDKPVTTLGRPGIQIAAIMRKPDGYFLMHIESDDSVERPTLNRDVIGDEPVMLHSGDELNVAGIDVEFMLS